MSETSYLLFKYLFVCLLFPFTTSYLLFSRAMHPINLDSSRTKTPMQCTCSSCSLRAWTSHVRSIFSFVPCFSFLANPNRNFQIWASPVGANRLISRTRSFALESRQRGVPGEWCRERGGLYLHMMCYYLAASKRSEQSRRRAGLASGSWLFAFSAAAERDH